MIVTLEEPVVAGGTDRGASHDPRCYDRVRHFYDMNWGREISRLRQALPGLIEDSITV
jgi:hypothetical protein